MLELKEYGGGVVLLCTLVQGFGGGGSLKILMTFTVAFATEFSSISSKQESSHPEISKNVNLTPLDFDSKNTLLVCV